MDICHSFRNISFLVVVTFVACDGKASFHFQTLEICFKKSLKEKKVNWAAKLSPITY